MIRKIILFLLILVAPQISQAKIFETQHIADVIPLIDQNTWFLVDLDNTLFEGKEAVGHANWFYDMYQQRLDKGMTRDEAIRDFYPFWIKSQRVADVQPLEDSFVTAIQNLQQQGVVVIGLTHRQVAVADFTLRQVTSLGIDFTLTAPSKETFSIPSVNPTLYKQGVLFVSDFNKKGDIFIPFLAMVMQRPTKVVFIDDKKKNVEELEKALEACGIEYIGVYYTAIEHAKPVYNREVAEFQYKYLDKILSNEAVQVLMQHGVK